MQDSGVVPVSGRPRRRSAVGGNLISKIELDGRAAHCWNLTVDQLHTYYVLAGNTPVLVHNASCKIDTIAEDWAQKGFHVKLPGQGSAGEVSVSADETGNLIFRSTFSGKAGRKGIAQVEKDFQDPAFRAKALVQAQKGLDFLEQSHSYSNQIPGLRNLVNALSGGSP